MLPKLFRPSVRKIILVIENLKFKGEGLWRPGIALGVTQRQPAFKVIT